MILGSPHSVQELSATLDRVEVIGDARAFAEMRVEWNALLDASGS